MTAQQKLSLPPMSVDEFLTWDGGGHVGKLELVEGTVRAMAPASLAHGTIQLNIGAALQNHLRGTKSRCRVATEPPVVPPMRQTKNARAPDVAVTCAPLSNSKVMDDPMMIVEVISPSNEDETWESISTLASLTSLKEIVVIQSTLIGVGVYTRDPNGNWPSEPVMTATGGTVRFASLDLEVPISEIYRDTPLEPAARGDA